MIVIIQIYMFIMFEIVENSISRAMWKPTVMYLWSVNVDPDVPAHLQSDVALDCSSIN